MVPCLISNLFRLQIATIYFFIGVCIPSLSDALGCNLFEHIEDNLLIFFSLYLTLLRISISYFKSLLSRLEIIGPEKAWI